MRPDRLSQFVNIVWFFCETTITLVVLLHKISLQNRQSFLMQALCIDTFSQFKNGITISGVFPYMAWLVRTNKNTGNHCGFDRGRWLPCRDTSCYHWGWLHIGSSQVDIIQHVKNCVCNVLFRIPQQGSPPVLYLHGYQSSSAEMVLTNQSLGFMMADHGFDVWLINFRGNAYSRNHTVSPKSQTICAVSWPR